MRGFFLILLLYGLWVPVGLAATTQSLQEVSKAVEQAAQNMAPPDAQVSIGTVDGARYMPACTTPLNVMISGVAPYEQATVRCATPAWTLYVNVAIAQHENVVVAAKPLVAGQTIVASDLMLKSLPVQNFAGRQVFTNPDQIEGASVMMSLAAGMLITQNIVQAPLMVKTGQMVTVNVYSGNVMLSLDAVADQDGRIGDTILLTNPSSGRRFTAEVTAQGVDLRL